MLRFHCNVFDSDFTLKDSDVVIGMGRDDTVPLASATLIPLSEYLKTSYRPDCDYIDGEVKERNAGEISHSFTQAILAAIFNSNRRLWEAVAGTELRVRVSA